MKIQIQSDIHLEFHKTLPTVEAKADLLVLAGDIGSATNPDHIDWVVEQASKFRLGAIYVPGNHEFYGNSLAMGMALLREDFSNEPNVHFLNNDTVTIEGKRFIGSTMWSDIPNRASAALSCLNFSDMQYIEFLNKDTYTDAHREATAYLDRNLYDGLDNKDAIIVTHHAPSVKSSHPRFNLSEIGHFFATDMEDFIIRKNPLMWIHGHTHDKWDYYVGDTRILCNPVGYPGEVFAENNFRGTIPTTLGGEIVNV